MSNQHTVPTGREKKWRVLAHVKAHPRCTSIEIGVALGLDPKEVGTILVRLFKNGDVRKEKRDNSRIKEWTAGKEPEIEVPRQIVTRSWVANHTGHWLDFAICAPARQLQGGMQ